MNAASPTDQIRQIFSKSSRRQRWVDVEAALATAQAEVGMIPTAAAARIVQVASLDLLDEDALDAEEAVTGHVMVPIIHELGRVAGAEAGGWVHWGVTTQNVQQTGDTIGIVQALDLLEGQLLTVIRAVVALTEAHAETRMAGRTHWQHAVPITFGYKTAAWLDVMLRHRERMQQLRPRLAVSMTAGAAGTFATLGERGPRIQELVAEQLGLVPMTVPARGIVDHFAEFVTVLAMLAASSSQIAGEVSRLMAVEFGELSEAIPPGDVGSSTMPQKRNPKLSGGVVTHAALVQAAVAPALEAMIQSHEVDGARSALMDRVVADSAVNASEMLRLLGRLLSTLEVFPDRMTRNLNSTRGLIVAEAVMMSLGAHLGRQVAHDLVHAAATEAAVSDTDFLEVLRREPRITAVLSAQELDALLDPAQHTGLSSRLARETVERARQILATG